MFDSLKMIQFVPVKVPYCHPEAHNRTGRTFGLGCVSRLSELSLAQGRTIEWHAHDEVEVLCCLHGSLNYEFRDRRGVAVTSGCYLVIPPGLEHRLVGGVDGPCRRISLFLTARPPATPRTQVFTSRECRNLLADILKRRLRPRTFSPETKAGLVRLANLLVRPTLTAHERVELRVRTACALLDLDSERPPERNNSQSRLIDEATRWLQSHYAEKVTLGQLTAFMGYGASRLCQLFKARTGLAPLEWLIRYRIDRACELLTDSDLTVVEIARRVGFDDPSFFARVFRKRIGLSPSDYRRNRVTDRTAAWMHE